jgi:hypothetical protein
MLTTRTAGLLRSVPPGGREGRIHCSKQPWAGKLGGHVVRDFEATSAAGLPTERATRGRAAETRWVLGGPKRTVSFVVQISKLEAWSFGYECEGMSWSRRCWGG